MMRLRRQPSPFMMIEMNHTALEF